MAVDPFNSAIIDDLTFALNLEVFIVVCDPLHVSELLDKYYGEEEADMAVFWLMLVLTNLKISMSQRGDLVDAANETPIIRFVNLVLQQAIRAKASDIHFEPFENEFRIRYRVDGPFTKCRLRPRVWLCPSFPGSK